MKVKTRDLELIYELGCLRFIPRTWKRFLNADFANLADHHMRVAWTALILANYEGITDTDKVLKMALLHDIPESRTGDVDYLSRQYTERNEDLGLADMLAGTILEEEMTALWKEYELRESPESRVVKDADNLDVDLEMREQFSNGIEIGGGAKWLEIRKQVYDTKLYTKSAKSMWRAVQASHPHDWHILGRNRFNGGDWKK